MQKIIFNFEQILQNNTHVSHLTKGLSAIYYYEGPQQYKFVKRHHKNLVKINKLNKLKLIVSRFCRLTKVMMI